MVPAAPPCGVLLVNLGTPDAPEPADVRRFLAEFLDDPRVVDLPSPARALLLHGVILPFRPGRVSEAYRKIWTPEGSPLLVHGRNLAGALGRALGEGFRVTLGMRYGRPTLAQGIDTLLRQGADRLVIAPLYPHRTASTTGTTLAEAWRLLAPLRSPPAVSTLPAYHAAPEYLDALTAVLQDPLAASRADHLLLSFHALPESHVRAEAEEAGRACVMGNCCATLHAGNAGCYRAQCLATARALAARLARPDGAWSVSFQSRVGPQRWLEPATEATLSRLARSGVRRVAVACPGFAADCLETLEEIGLRGRETFLSAGGESLNLLPCLNDHPAWVSALATLVRRVAG